MIGKFFSEIFHILKLPEYILISILTYNIFYSNSFKKD